MQDMISQISSSSAGYDAINSSIDLAKCGEFSAKTPCASRDSWRITGLHGEITANHRKSGPARGFTVSSARAPAFTHGAPRAGSAPAGANTLSVHIGRTPPAALTPHHGHSFDPPISPPRWSREARADAEEAAAASRGAGRAGGLHKRADAGEYGFPHLPSRRR